jgi:hypothetical protein
MKKLTILIFLCVTNLIGQTFVLSSSATNFEDAEAFLRDNKNDIVIDTKTNLMWQDDRLAKTTIKNWHNGITHCKELKFASFEDWRLPTVVELMSIVDYGRGDIAIDKNFKNINDTGYWSSSEAISDKTTAWAIDSKTGFDTWTLKTNDEAIRCVRDVGIGDAKKIETTKENKASKGKKR